MAEETQFTANTGMVTISTANDLLTGSGTLGTVLTAGSNGTIVKSLTIKAVNSTTEGCVRLFIQANHTTKLLSEIHVPAITRSAVDRTFERVVPLNLSLESGAILKASTQNAESFNIIADAVNWAYYASSVRTDTTQYTSASARGSLSIANSNLDGTGSLSTICTAASSTGWKGLCINGILIEATGATTTGMIRIFVQDASTNIKLLTEVPVEQITPSGTTRVFTKRIVFKNKFHLQPGYSFMASTEKGEYFTVNVDACNWDYLA